jgi:thiosulfate reductase cytochrome b subunit
MKHQLQRRDRIQIAYHWANFAAIALLVSTGLAIFFGADGTASLFAWHLWAAWLLIAALVVHVWYSTITWRRFDRMWISRADLKESMARLRRSGGATHFKHGHYKVEQILFHWFIAADVIGLIVTGLILWKPSRMLVAPFWLPWGWDAIYASRVLHDLFTFVLVATVLAHIYFALCVPKNLHLLKSMFTGRVALDEYAKEHRLSPRLQEHVTAENNAAPSSSGQRVGNA